MPVDHQEFQRDGHALVRGLASREEIDAYRPVIEEVVSEVARRGDAQQRIDDYSKLFTQVTNIWRLSDAAREIVFNPRFARAAAELLGVPAVRLYHDQALRSEERRVGKKSRAERGTIHEEKRPI